MKRIIGLMTMLVMLSMTAMGQSIVCKKQGTKADATLEANLSAITFVSSLGDWSIASIKKLEGDVDITKTKDSNGKYLYEYRANVSEDYERTFILGRKGSAITTQCVAKSLRKGYRTTYELEEEADTLMRVEAQPNGDFGVYPQEGKACVEITTSLEIISVKTDWSVKEETTANGARRFTIVIEPDRLKQLKTAIDALRKESKQLEDAGEFLKIEAVDKQLEEKEAAYDKLESIAITGKGVKTLMLPIADIGIKEKRRYAVIAITESFESLLDHARTLKGQMNSHLDFGFYDATVIAYDKAINHKDAPTEQLEGLRNERNGIASIRKYIYLMGKAQEKADAAEKEKGAEAEEVYKNLSARCKIAQILLESNPEINGLQEVYNNTLARLEKHPMFKERIQEKVTEKRQVLTGKVVKGSSFLMNIAGLRVFAVNLPGKIKDKDYKKEIGKIAADGSFRIVLVEPTPYIYIEGELKSRRISPTTSNMGTLILEH